MPERRLTQIQQNRLAEVATAPRAARNRFELQTLASLEARGLAMSYRSRRAGGGYLYHITAAGRAALKDDKTPS